MQDPGVRVEFSTRRRDRLDQRRQPTVHGDEAQALDEALHSLALGRAPPRLLDRLPRQVAKAFIADVAPRRADDPEARRHQPDLRQVEHPRQQFPLRQIPRRPEQHDHMIRGLLLRGSRPTRAR